MPSSGLRGHEMQGKPINLPNAPNPFSMQTDFSEFPSP